MKSIIVATLLALFFVATYADEAVDESDVLVLTTATFDQAISDNEAILVEFYAPWCGHCKRLTPEYAKAATEVKADGIVLAKVDATEEQDLATRFGVQGYPTLKWFKGGKDTEYGGGRDAASIVKWVRSHAGDAARKLETAAAVKEFLTSVKENDVVVVGEFAKADSESHKAFVQAAEALREEYRFGVRTGVKDVPGGARVSVHRKFHNEDAVRVLEGAAATTDERHIREHVARSSLPLAGLLTAENAKRYDLVGVPRVTLFMGTEPEKDPAGMRYYMNRMRKVAQEFVGDLVFALTHAGTDRAFSELNFDPAAKFALAAFSTEGYKYKADAEALEKFSVDTLRAFCKSLVDGTAEKYVKSEPVPAADDGEAVRTVVGKNFDDVVTSSPKDVFIEFYAPWCGHCKQLAPKWKELAESLADVDSVTIAAIDATANDYPKTYNVRGFPTIYLKKATGELVAYEGGREVSAMKKWLKENTHHKLGALPNKDEL